MEAIERLLIPDLSNYLENNFQLGQFMFLGNQPYEDYGKIYLGPDYCVTLI